jgi:branched-chain amino acid transport system substrate-binding protein
MRPIRRRSILQGLAAGASILPFSRVSFAQSGDPVRIAVLAPLSGFAASFGADFENGAKIAEQQLNESGGVIGRQVEVIVRDDKTNANEAVAVVRELAGDGVNMFVGGPLTPMVLGAMGILPSLNGTMIAVGAMGDGITQEAYNRNSFRITEGGTIRGRALGRFAARRFPEITKWGSIIGDNSAGESQWLAFASGIRQYYKEIAGVEAQLSEPMRVKYGANDFKNEISRVMSSDDEGLLIAHPDPVTLHQQARAFGWERKIKAFLDMGNDVQMANALGAATPPNVWTTSHWFFGAYQDIPMGKALYDAYVARTNDPRPSGFVGAAHMAVTTYAQAVEAAGGTETEAVIAALEEGAFQTAGGERRFRKEDHQALGDFNAYHIVADQGAPNGWEVGEFVVEDDAEVALPPSPGEAVEYPE